MRRRDFVSILGGAAVGWPLVVRAQQVPVIGYLGSRGPVSDALWTAQFVRGLTENGFEPDRAVRIEHLWAEGQFARLPALAGEFVNRKVSLIVTAGNSAAAQAAKRATTTIPVLFSTGDDPIRAGLVPSINRPGGNVSGLTTFAGQLTAKRLGLLLELVPGAATVGFISDPSNVAAQAEKREAEVAAKNAGRRLLAAEARNLAETDAALAQMVRDGAKALLLSSGFLAAQSREVPGLVARHAIPAMFSNSASVDAGGLMSYGTSFAENYHQLGVYAARILKGEKPADLPVMQPTKFDLVLNLKTAKALGLIIPPGVLAIADAVIE